MLVQLQYVELINDKTNAADLLSVFVTFTVFISVTRTIKIQDSLPFHKFYEILAKSDVTKEALNCAASL